MVMCAAYGCNINSNTHRGISMFNFPRDSKRKRQWIQRLNRGRTATCKFVPSVHSKLCMKHFDDDQFNTSPKLAIEFGYVKFRPRLKPDAIPSIFANSRRGDPEGTEEQKSRASARSISTKKLRHELKSIKRIKLPILSPTPQQNLDVFEDVHPISPSPTPPPTFDALDEVYTAVPLFPAVTTSPSVASITTAAITTTDTSSTETSTSSHLSPCSLTWFADLTSTLPQLSTTTDSETNYEHRPHDPNYLTDDIIHVPTHPISPSPTPPPTFDALDEVYTAVPLFPAVTTSPSVASITTAAITTTDTSSTETSTSSHLSPCSLTWFADLTSTLPQLSTTTDSETNYEHRPHDPNYLTDDIIHVPTQTENKPIMVSSFSQTPYNLVKRRTFSTQCVPKTQDKGTQTTPISTRRQLDNQPDVESSFEESFVSVESESGDPDWQPDSDFEMETECDYNPAKERKFIVFESCLDQLLNKCTLCGSETSVNKKTVGSGLVCDIVCSNCNDKRLWRSQPLCGGMPLGNLILSAAIMFCGLSPMKVLRALDFASILSVGISTFTLIQKAYLTPTIMSVWKRQQQSMVNEIKESGRPLKLGGDMRCCSPGHTAKYGSYTFIDLEGNQVIDIELVQSNEVRNSYAMELEGLKRGLDWMKTKDLTVTDLITDRHSSVKKYMREDRPEINHWFDVWHVAKGVYKKLEAAGKKKGCAKVKDWARSISNHMYWCAASSDGDGELVLQKWLSILNHVTNVHSGHGDKFPNCEHGPLEDRDWFIKGCKPYAEMEKIVKGRLLIHDVKKLSPAEQTSSLESFHNVVCQFASKSVHYFYAQMEARLALAALHYNENSGRAQAVTKDGSLRWRIGFPKSRHGEAIARPVKTKITFNYIDELMVSLIEKRNENDSYLKARVANGESRAPNPIAHSTPRPKKDDVVRAHRARFNK